MHGYGTPAAEVALTMAYIYAYANLTRVLPFVHVAAVLKALWLSV